MAASKLVADREKDRLFVTSLLVEKLIDGDVLMDRVDALPLDAERIETIKRWVSIIATDVA